LLMARAIQDALEAGDMAAARSLYERLAAEGVSPHRRGDLIFLRRAVEPK